MTANSTERPYKPSWVDRFNDWVEQLPIRSWVFYGGLGLGLILVQVIFLWLDGGLPKAEVLMPLVIFNACLLAFGLALMQLLDRQAVTALNAMRPTLEMTESELDDFQYRLSTMPAGPTLIAGLLTLGLLIVSERVWIEPARFAALEQLPVFTIVFQILDKVPAFVFGAFFYHTIRQLRLVNTINSEKYVRVHLFNLGPLEVFSKLTATTAVGLVVGAYGWTLINPDLLASPVSPVSLVLMSVLAIGVFVWPLFGAHRLMETEKHRVLHELDLRFEAVFSKLDQQVHNDDYSEIDKLNGTIASLEIRYKRIASIPTWPWRPETARLVLSAIALPLILTILQLVAAQVLGW
ncbi:MAG: hypothetical protein PVI80_23415 [Anaerolineae bacterium]|jgi:hypothetical protein